MVKEGAKKSGRRAVGGAAKAPAKDKDEGEEEESEKVEEFRFKHLLEPIRDLTVNWNVDIARDLEGYLGELELLEISLDGGDNLLNFAEAALLIQGSTCVYSKKVEYLHKLVFQVLAIISDTKKSVLRAEEDDEQEGGDPDCDFPEDPEFIALDDLPEAKPSSINMVEGNDKCDGDHLVEATPMILMMNLEDDIGADPNKDLKLANSSVHSSGALLLDASYGKMLDGKLEPIPLPDADMVLSPERIRADNSADISLGLAAPAGADPAADGSELAMIPEMEAGGDDDFDDGGWGGDDAGDDDADAADYADEPRQVDPWRMLDPHDASGGRAKPFKKGKTWRQAPVAGKAALRHVAASQVELDIAAHQSRSLKLAYFADFAGAFLQERSRLQSARAAEARSHRPPPPAGSGGGYQHVEDDYDEVDLPHLDGDNADAGGEVDYGAGDGFGGGDDDDDDYAPLEEDTGADFPGDAADGSARTGAARVWVGASGLDPKTVDEMSYQDMCKAYIDRYLRGVEDFMHQSELERRVGDWHKNIEPKLQEEEERAVFDIHVYGERMKDKHRKSLEVSAEAGLAEGPVPFADVVKGMTRHDVCRTLLATLQLANDGGVELSLRDEKDRTSLEVRVLEGEASYKSLGAYEAPSMASARKKSKVGRNQLGASPLRRANSKEDAVHLAAGDPGSDKENEEDLVITTASAVAEALASQAPTQPVRAGGSQQRGRKANKEN